jgi:hypothetical protein
LFSARQGGRKAIGCTFFTRREIKFSLEIRTRKKRHDRQELFVRRP